MIKSKLIFLFLTGALLAACGDDNAPTVDSKAYPLVIEAKVYDYGANQEGKTWNNSNETIGVYVLKGGSGEVVSPHSNLTYSATPTSYDDYFQPGDINTIPYFPPTGEDIWDVAIYYPYQKELATEGMIPLQLNQQGNLKSTSLLYARVNSLDKENRIASMRLAPVLSRLFFSFRANETVTADDLSTLNVKLSGLPTAGNFNVLTGRFTADEESVKSFGMKMRTPEATATKAVTSDTPAAQRTAEAFVMPLGSTLSYVAEISIPKLGKSHKYVINQDIGSLSKSTQYLFDVTVDKDHIDVKTSSSPISGWEEGDHIGGEGEEMNP